MDYGAVICRPISLYHGHKVIHGVQQTTANDISLPERGHILKTNIDKTEAAIYCHRERARQRGCDISFDINHKTERTPFGSYITELCNITT